MHITRHNKITKQYGFSLWELSIVILIMIGLFIALVSVLPYIVKRENVTVNNQVLVQVDQQLLGFIATYNRLPCPAANANGIEDCSLDSGSLPYKTLGLNENYAGVGSIPIAYAVYRNTASAADLTNITDLFNPTDSHGTITTLNNINGLDFCTALANGSASTFSSSFAHVALPDGTTLRAVPYIVISAGLTDADGVGNAFDGRNSNATMDFESANKSHDSNYDDNVLSKSFDELASTLNCDTAINSLNLLADAKATHEENVAQAENLVGNAELAAIILGSQVVIGIANTAMAAFTLATAIGVLSAASALLAAAVASCVVLVGCALIPVYTNAVIFSTIAVVASGISIGLNIAAFIGQIAATILIVDVAIRAGATISVPSGTTDPATGNVTDNSDIAMQLRDQANMLRSDAVDKVFDTRTNVNSAVGLSATINNRFTTLVTETQTLVTSNAAVNDATFSSFSNASFNQASINSNQAQAGRNDLLNAQVNANDAVAALGAPSGVFVITYPNANFALINTELGLVAPAMTNAESNYSGLQSSYLNTNINATNARNRIITIRNNLPPLPGGATAAQIIARNNYLVVLDTAQARAQVIINDFATSYLTSIFDLLIRRANAQDALNEIIATRNDLISMPLPAGSTPQEIADRNAFLADLTLAENELNATIASLTARIDSGNITINTLDESISVQLGRVESAASTAADARGTVNAAIEADANAQEFEDALAMGTPPPTSTLLQQAAGVDDILDAADLKGVQN